MNPKNTKWFYLVFLSLVWGSSFILIKKGLLGLSAIQLGALRIVFSALILLGVGFRSLRMIQKKHRWPIVITAFIGTFIPAFLFSFAQTEIDSSIVGILNSLTPLNTIWVGILFFKFAANKKQILGIIIGLIGTITLISTGASVNPNQNYYYAILVVLASLGYAFNVNMIKKYLSDLNALSITAGHFIVIGIPSILVLYFSDFFSVLDINNSILMDSVGYIAILATIGTALAKVLFNKMVHLADPVFAASVTYLIPIVAFGWGFVDGEILVKEQILGACVILVGVFLANSSSVKKTNS